MDSPEWSAPVDGRVTLMISGMTCAGCVRSVEQMLSAVQGVAHVDVHLADGRAVVEGTALAEWMPSKAKATACALYSEPFNWRRAR